MKLSVHVLIGFVFISYLTSAQSDTMNRLDANNEKIGWWTTYLDKDLSVVENAKDAVYFRYSYFDGKFDYFNMGQIGTKQHPVIPPANQTVSRLSPLNGTYTAMYDDGQTHFELSAINGKLTTYKEYYPDGVLKTHFDYTTSCGDTPFHYCIYQYKKNGALKYKGTIQTPK